MSKMVEMKYVGPGTAPPNMKVKESEVKGLEKTKMWKKVGKKVIKDG